MVKVPAGCLLKIAKAFNSLMTSAYRGCTFMLHFVSDSQWHHGLCLLKGPSNTEPDELRLHLAVPAGRHIMAQCTDWRRSCCWFHRCCWMLLCDCRPDPSSRYREVFIAHLPTPDPLRTRRHPPCQARPSTPSHSCKQTTYTISRTSSYRRHWNCLCRVSPSCFFSSSP